MPEILCPLCEEKFMLEVTVPISASNVLAICPRCGWRFTAGRFRFVVELARTIVQENIEELVGENGSEEVEDLLEDFSEDARRDLRKDILISPEIMGHLKDDPPTPIDAYIRKRYRFITRTSMGFAYINPAKLAHPSVGHISKTTWSLEELEEDLKESREILKKQGKGNK